MWKQTSKEKEKKKKEEEIKENTSKRDRPNKWKCNCCLFLLMCIYVFRCVHSVESLASSVHSSTLSSSTCRHFCHGGQKHCALLLLSNMDSWHRMLRFYQQNNKGREIPFSKKTKKPVQLRNWRKKEKKKRLVMVGIRSEYTHEQWGSQKKSTPTTTIHTWQKCIEAPATALQRFGLRHTCPSSSTQHSHVFFLIQKIQAMKATNDKFHTQLPSPFS